MLNIKAKSDELAEHARKTISSDVSLGALRFVASQNSALLRTELVEHLLQSHDPQAETWVHVLINHVLNDHELPGRTSLFFFWGFANSCAQIPPFRVRFRS